jgi:hypothetical protein
MWQRVHWLGNKNKINWGWGLGKRIASMQTDSIGIGHNRHCLVIDGNGAHFFSNEFWCRCPHSEIWSYFWNAREKVPGQLSVFFLKKSILSFIWVGSPLRRKKTYYYYEAKRKCVKAPSRNRLSYFIDLLHVYSLTWKSIVQQSHWGSYRSR